MQRLGKIFITIGIFFVVLLAGLFVIVRISYEVGRQENCTIESTDIDIVSLQDRVEVANTSAEPYLVLRLEAGEVQSILNNILEQDGLHSCVKMENNKMQLFIERNPYVWVQADIVPNENEPYIRISRVHWNNITIPGLFELQTNIALKQAFDEYFQTNANVSRNFDRLEIDGTALLIYSSISP
ncbi:MAG: hypothetical protein QY314_02270 [Candidatus Dojkabacteria bacterium]|nr:MAG: hypothetical protein QY314_02270 [Candidatus Dojkabacteria bacterium]